MFMPQEDDREYKTSVRDLEQWFPTAGPRKFFSSPHNIFFSQTMPPFIEDVSTCNRNFKEKEKVIELWSILLCTQDIKKNPCLNSRDL